MIRLLIFTCAFIFGASDPIKHSHQGNTFVYTVKTRDNAHICSNFSAKMWSYDFHGCFIDRKYNDGGKDLNNIVDRILDLSKDCITNSTRECKLDFHGFMIIMDKVIYQMKDYCFIYLEHITHDRQKVKDLDCVEKTLSRETYKNCFNNTLDQDYSSEVFQREVEKAISCTNKANKPCSKVAKTSLNRMVRNILGVKQPANENIEDDPKPEPPKRWYDYIIQPFVSLWKAIKSFFGF
nr:venom protein [Lampona murina]